MAPLAHLKLLIALSRADGSFDDVEKNYILNIAQANHLPQADMDSLFSQKHEEVLPEHLSNDQKFDYIFSLVQLMKIDERMYKEELQFCSRIAARLGYQTQAMFDLLLHVRTEAMEPAAKEELKKSIEKYLA